MAMLCTRPPTALNCSSLFVHINKAGGGTITDAYTQAPTAHGQSVQHHPFYSCPRC